MNIHEAVVAPIAVFVYCNRYALPVGATAGDTLNAPDARACARELRPR